MLGHKGRLVPSEYSQRRDSRSGAVVHQLTDHPSINHATYFLQSSFSPNGQTMLFISNRTGSWQLFAVDEYPTGEIRQLTDGPAIHPFSPAFHPTGERVFFVRGSGIWWLRLDSLEEGCLIDFGGGSMGECSFDSSGEWLVAAVKAAGNAAGNNGGQSGLAVGRTDGSGWHVIPFPRTVIHPQFHPLDGNWIEFAADPAPRIHRVRPDGTGLECLYQHDNDEFVVHETFLGRTGQLVYTVWPHALRSIDWETREHRTIAAFNAWHITPNRAGTAVLCDTNHPDDGIFIVDVASGSRRLVCLSEATGGGSQWAKSCYALAADFAAAQNATSPERRALSWMEMGTDTVYGPQWTHSHPSFSRDERSVVFTSDRTGSAQVYVAEIPFD